MEGLPACLPMAYPTIGYQHFAELNNTLLPHSSFLHIYPLAMFANVHVYPHIAYMPAPNFWYLPYQSRMHYRKNVCIRKKIAWFACPIHSLHSPSLLPRDHYKKSTWDSHSEVSSILIHHGFQHLEEKLVHRDSPFFS